MINTERMNCSWATGVFGWRTAACSNRKTGARAGAVGRQGHRNPGIGAGNSDGSSSSPAPGSAWKTDWGGGGNATG